MLLAATSGLTFAGSNNDLESESKQLIFFKAYADHDCFR